ALARPVDARFADAPARAVGRKVQALELRRLAGKPREIQALALERAVHRSPAALFAIDDEAQITVDRAGRRCRRLQHAGDAAAVERAGVGALEHHAFA